MAERSVAPTDKTCRVCGETKPLADFPKNRRVCRVCRAAYMQAWKHGVRIGPLHPIINGTHKVCSKCHTLQPLENFRLLRGKERKQGARCAECKACAAKHDQDYHATHPDIRPRLWRTYYHAKQPAMCLRAKIYYYHHHEERRASHRAWAKANPEKANAHGRKRKTVKRGLPSTFSHTEQAFCRQYFQYACAVCGNEEGFQWTLAMDHWIPISSRACPGTIATNMIPLCHGEGGCNNSKGNKDPNTWLLAKFGKRKAAQIVRNIERYFAAVRAQFSITDSDQQGAL